MKIAAVQMTADLGQVEKNMRAAEGLVREAFARGAEMVILPEFFTSAMGFSPVMDRAARPVDGEPVRLLQKPAADHNGMVGGSCWWNLPDAWLPGFTPRVKKQNLAIMKTTPAPGARHPWSWPGAAALQCFTKPSRVSTESG